MTSSLSSAIALSRLSAHTSQMERATCSIEILDIFVTSVMADSRGCPKMLFDIPGISTLGRPKPEPSLSASKKRKRNRKHNLEKAHDIKPANLLRASPQSVENVSAGNNAFHKKLSGARFRQLNELLYTCGSGDAWKYFCENGADFEHYHSGWRSQQQSGWKIRPVDVISCSIISDFKACQRVSVADMGCGEGILAELLSEFKNYRVHSFDLVSIKPFVIACDICKTPLEDNSVHAAVFSLSLMNTNYGDSLIEARRILRPGSRIYIAEVESRFGGTVLEEFIAAMTRMGFAHTNTNTKHRIFILMEFTLANKDKKTTSTHCWPKLKPCIYKRR